MQQLELLVGPRAVSSRLDLAPVLAEQVDLPGGIETDDGRDVLQTGGVRSSVDRRCNAPARKSAVLYMSRGEAPQLVDALRAAGLPADHPVAIVESASLPHAHRVYCTLGELPQRAGETGPGPALVMLGDVLREAVVATERETPTASSINEDATLGLSAAS